MFSKLQNPEWLITIPEPVAATLTIPQPASLLPSLQVRDAVAVIRYLVWLEKNVPKGTVDEFSGAELVDKFRG